MSEQIQERLVEVFNLIPCPIVGCWSLHGAQIVYYHDEESASENFDAHNDNEPPLLYELAEFDFIELTRTVALDHFHFSQKRAVFEIGWKEFGTDLEIKAHLVPQSVE